MESPFSIEFVNHASFIVRAGGKSIIVDPWLEGSVFDNGWRHISKTLLPYDAFNNIDYIWFSHEHPDHFHPPSLRLISEEAKAGIKVLYQATVDKKVEEYCKKAGFADTIPLDTDTPYTLAEDFTITCNAWTYGDSYCWFKIGDTSILNINDCAFESFEELEKIKNSVGTADIIFLQFAYANKVGNPADTHLRNEAIAQKIRYFGMTEQIFQPRFMIPFASFIYFSHEENGYMNDHSYSIGQIREDIEKELKQSEVLLMYPGDQWEPGKEWNNDERVTKYHRDYENDDRKIDRSESVSIDELQLDCDKFLKGLHERNNKIYKGFWEKSATVKLSDYGKTFQLHYTHGLKETDDSSNADIELSSAALNYAFTNLWGGDTLNVNARFTTTKLGVYGRFKILGVIASYNNRGEEMEIKKQPFFTRLRQFIKHYYGVFFK